MIERVGIERQRITWGCRVWVDGESHRKMGTSTLERLWLSWGAILVLWFMVEIWWCRMMRRMWQVTGDRADGEMMEGTVRMEWDARDHEWWWDEKGGELEGNREGKWKVEWETLFCIGQFFHCWCQWWGIHQSPRARAEQSSFSRRVSMGQHNGHLVFHPSLPNTRPTLSKL